MRAAAKVDLFSNSNPDPVFSEAIPYEVPQAGVTPNGLVLVGEAPGAEEAKLGRPFVGRSGQLLDKMLVEAGIERKECLIANVFRRQPPGNKVDHFFVSRKGSIETNKPIREAYGKFGSSFCRAEFAVDIDFLKSTLEAYRTSTGGRMTILALGRTPFWALTGESGLLQKVGRPFPSRLVKDTSVIPTFHPSFILRGNWRLKEEWVAHLKSAKKAALL